MNAKRTQTLLTLAPPRYQNTSPNEAQVAQLDTPMEPCNEVPSLVGRMASADVIEGGEDGLVLGTGVTLTPFGKFDKMTFFGRTPH